MTDYSTNPGIVNVDENGNKYGRKTTGNVPHVLISDSNGVEVENDPLVNNMPMIETFHNLGHRGDVFIHSDRHNGITTNFDVLIRIPAGNADRQVHMRYNYSATATAGTLDMDIILYKDPIISADGDAAAIVSTNDAVVKTTEVCIFESPTVTNVGTLKALGTIAGEKKATGNKEQAVPEWVLAPDGTNARDYLFRARVNGNATIDVTNSIFFYDSEAE